MIVFTHIPKTAGTSIRDSIIKKKGEAAIFFDYSRPFSDSEIKRNIKCIAHSFTSRRNREQKIIFGHFMTGKYCNFTTAGFVRRPGYSYVTFLRDPLQRAVSHFHYWKRIVGTDNRVWVKFTNENWDLERFLTSNYFANFQSKFLYGCNLDTFDFVGVTEQYDRSLELLGSYVPGFEGLNLVNANVNPLRKSESAYDVPGDMRRAFARLNGRDYELYEACLKRLDEAGRIR